MAIYRPQRPAWRVALLWGGVGLLVGLLVGWGLLRPEPDPAEVLSEVRSSLASASATLEVVQIEYAESVEDGEIVARAEFEGARDALASSRASYSEARSAVAAVESQTASAIDSAYEGVERAMAARGDERDVSEMIAELRQMLDEALGG
jgi:hypothetical protein